VLNKIEEELGEVREALAAVRNPRRGRDRRPPVRGGEPGPARGVDPESALRRTNAKFERRFGWMEARLAQTQESPRTVDLARLEELWVEAKRQEDRRRGEE
jgi:ATP diphosphatase